MNLASMPDKHDEDDVQHRQPSCSSAAWADVHHRALQEAFLARP